MTTRPSTLITFLALTIILTACATPSSLYAPAARMQSPTVSGGFANGSLGLIASPVVRIDTVRNIDSTPPISSGSDVGVPFDAVGLFSIVGLKFDFGIFPMADLFYENGSAGGRIQLFGDQSHGFVGTLSVSHDSFMSADEDTTGIGTTSSVKSEAFDGGVSLGYAVNDVSVPYISYGHKKIWAKTYIHQTATEYDYHQTGTQDVFAAGLQCKTHHLDFQIEGGTNITYWPGASSYNDGFVAASLAYRWGEEGKGK